MTNLRTRLGQWLLQAEPRTVWQAKQELAASSRYYGDGGTIHHDNVIDVVTFEGQVTEVWFRCQMLAFNQSKDEDGDTPPWLSRAEITQGAKITGVEVLDV